MAPTYVVGFPGSPSDGFRGSARRFMSNPSDIAALKAGLRRQALARRAAMAPEARASASRAAAERALPLLRDAGGPVALFSAIRGEIDPAPLAEALSRAGIATALPVVSGRAVPLVFRRWTLGDRLDPDPLFGIAQPRAEAPLLVPAAILVPLAAFDRKGGRIGYGGGFYDRTLAGLDPRPLAFGYAFACQEVPRVPMESHDVPLDMVITQDDVISCSAD